MHKSKRTAGILAFFGGIIGMHKFYLNEPGTGIFYIMLSLITGLFFPISMLLGVLDAFKIFSMSDGQFDAIYNKQTKSRYNVPKNFRRKQSKGRRDRDMLSEREQYKNEKISKSNRSNPFLKSARRKKEDFDLEGAIEDYEKAIEISKEDKSIHFEMAGIYSILEKTDKSLFHLNRAIELGFNKLDKISESDAFAHLRIQREYEVFVNNGYTMDIQKSIAPPKDDLLQDDRLLAQLNKLKELRSRGMLSEKEFLYEKEKIMRK